MVLPVLPKLKLNLSAQLLKRLSTISVSSVWPSISLSNLSTVAAVLSATLLVSIFNSATPVSPVLATTSVYFFISSGLRTEPKPLDTFLILSKATLAFSAEKTFSDKPVLFKFNSLKEEAAFSKFELSLRALC